MDWVAAYHYVMILQQERLQRASEPGREISLRTVHKWLRAVREMREHRDRPTGRIAVKRGSAVPKGGSPT